MVDLFPTPAITVKHRLAAAEPRDEGRPDMTFSGDLNGVGGVPRGYPDRRVGVLPRARPDIDLAVMKKLSFPVERSFMAGLGLEDQIMGFPHTFPHAHGVTVAGGQFERHAAHKTAFEPAMGNHVDHRHFLGNADRLTPIGKRIAEQQQARIPGLARQDGRHQ